MNEEHNISFASAVNEAIKLEMAYDPFVVSMGLGHNDPKRIFGTTKDLLEDFGPERARDMPISENAVTGICVGLALRGYKPILTHQRVDFALLSMDQIVNSAAKWRYMFNRTEGLPIVIRMIVGRGWGQGPTHSQSLQSWFAHIPGLKVVMPSNAKDAKGMLASAIQDPNPVIFLEHRWLHDVEGLVSKSRFFSKLEQTKIMGIGKHFTVVASSLMVIEAMKARQYLTNYGVEMEVVEVATLRPFNAQPIIDSVKKTGHLLVMDNANMQGSFSSEIVSRVVESCMHNMSSAPVRLAAVDLPFPTSFGLTNNIYSDANSIISHINKLNEKNIPLLENDDFPHDVPGDWFKGPF